MRYNHIFSNWAVISQTYLQVLCGPSSTANSLVHDSASENRERNTRRSSAAGLFGVQGRNPKKMEEATFVKLGPKAIEHTTYFNLEIIKNSFFRMIPKSSAWHSQHVSNSFAVKYKTGKTHPKQNVLWTVPFPPD